MPNDATREENIFDEVIRLSDPAARSAFLDKVCGNDTQLRQSIDRLLEAYYQAKNPLDVPVGFDSNLDFDIDHDSGAQTIDAPPGTIQSGSIIAGKYKILSRLGKGGMGVVFLAEQFKPVKMTVAIKIVIPELESEDVLSRFDQEKQALALLNHPNIAKIFDAGTTDEGRPYFSMEYVPKGVPLDKYCNEHKLSVEERLKLFEDVCHAVQHAHHKGIIHRDLKPTNILVGIYDDRPVPKVIDFGVARATTAPLTENTLDSRIDRIVGTLEYMAPEQAEFNQVDIDTRADIYSLGVVLYELLTGGRPIDTAKLKMASWLEKLRVIREVEPQKPSTRLSSDASLPSVAAERKLEPKRLRKFLHGDLDWIVMKALDKQRSRRYDTANSFALDVQRFLLHEPVLAGPPSAVYRMRKMVRRHRTSFTAGLLIALALLAGGISAAVGWVRATRAENVAMVEAERARDAEARARNDADVANLTVKFLTEDILSQAMPDSQLETYSQYLQNMTVRQAVDRSAQLADRRFVDQPLLEAAMQYTLGKAYAALGQFEVAERHLFRAERLRVQKLGEADPTTLQTGMEIGKLRLFQSKAKEAASNFKEVYEQRRVKLGEADPKTLNARFYLAMATEELGNDKEAFTQLTEIYALQTAQSVPRTNDALLTLRQIAGIHDKRGEFAVAEKLLLEVLDEQRSRLGLEHSETQATWNNLVFHYYEAKNYVKAESSAKELISANQRVGSEDNLPYLVNQNNLASIYCDLKQYDKAIAIFETLVPQLKRLLTDRNEVTIGASQNLAACLINTQKYDRAEKLLIESFALCRDVWNDTHERTVRVAENLLALYKLTKNEKKAAEMAAFLKSAASKK